jgi:hypothetical protein
MRRSMGNTRSLLSSLALVWLASATAASAIEPLQVDTFDDGTTLGWQSGGANPNPPAWRPTGGPAGPGDGYLLVESTGGSGAGGNLVAFNTDQWAGDYAAAGVAAIGAWVRNEGGTDLTVRLLVEGADGSFLTAAAVFLPAGSAWRPAAWPLAPLGAVGDPAGVLARVEKLRILYAPTEDTIAPIAGMLGVDDVRALSGDACLDAGLVGGDLALCRVHCERLDCCGTRSRGRSCSALEANLVRRTGALPPCARDADGDGWTDDVDGCVTVPDPDQADRDGDGVGDACDVCPDDANPDQDPAVCDCPCFTGAEIEALVETLADDSTYMGLACFDERPGVKALTFVGALRLDGAPCSTSSQDCSALSAEFTEDNACQYNPPAPAPQRVVDGIDAAQREVCRAAILRAADRAGLTCN